MNFLILVVDPAWQSSIPPDPHTDPVPIPLSPVQSCSSMENSILKKYKHNLLRPINILAVW